MSRNLLSRRDLSHTELRGYLPRTRVESNVRRRTQALTPCIWRDTWGCQRDIDCQRVSAPMALTVCPIQARSTLAGRNRCRACGCVSTDTLPEQSAFRGE